MNRSTKHLPVLIMVVMLCVAGCSGGGGSNPPPPGGGGQDDTPPPVQPVSGTVIKGTVPGTIIHAFGDDGSYYKTETNPSDPPPRSFSLQVKASFGYRLVFQEGPSSFYPLKFASGKGGDTNRFYMSLVNGTLDLGNINYISGGFAVPSNNPLDRVDSDGDGTADKNDSDYQVLLEDPLDIDGDFMPNSLDGNFISGPSDGDRDGIPDAQDSDIDNDGIQNTTDPDADANGVVDSIDDLLKRATDQVLARNVQGAYQSFQEIVTREPNHQLGNLGLAITRIGAVLTDFNPGTDPAKLETMKEILDRAGFSQQGRDVSNFTATPPVLSRTVTVNYGSGYSYSYLVSCYVFPNDSPTPVELRAYLNERLVPQIEAALTNLDKITPGFTYTPPASLMVAGMQVRDEVDYSDVLALKAALRGVLTVITFLSVYEIDFDLDDLVNNGTCNSVDPVTYRPVPAQTFFSRYPDLGKLVNPSALSGLKARATAMMDDAIAALDAVNNETDDQTNDLLTIDRTTYAADRADLLKLKATFDGPVTFVLRGGRSLTWNSAPIFSGINLRNYLPALKGDRVVYSSIRAAGYDPTIQGVLPNFTREDVVRLVDHEPPNVTFVGLSGTVSNPISFQVSVDDVERLSDGTTQIGAGVDPASLTMQWSCGHSNCSVTGKDSNQISITTPSYGGDITRFLAVSGPIGGTYSWAPNGGSVTVNKGTTGTSYNYAYVQVRDLAGNARWWAQTNFTIP